jgi:succinate-acetate transporter protein
MSTRTQPPPWGENADSWAARTRVVLQPIAPPSILGLFAFAGATFIVAAHLAGWYGTTTSPEYLFPFAAIFGGVAQFAAGMWAYRARDGLATAMHGMWGSFWMAYGILFLLVAVGAVTVPASGSFPELGYWFLALGVITAFGALAALAEGVGLFVTLTTLAVGSGLLAVHYLTGGSGWETAGGWVLVGSAVAATYTAAAMMLEGAWGRVILPLGKYEREANIPGARFTKAIENERAMPGVRQGQ